uniref:J domain-containing protein n=1 Tax=Alexandrium monilatum TaxID=311494 RepID=A0A7S4UEY8_9DINO
MAEANKDEADKCKRIAKSALAGGDTEKAVRFLQKAKRMCPGDASIDTLLAEVASGAAGGDAADPRGGAASAEEGPRYRGSQGASGGAAAGSAGAGRGAGGGAARAGKDGTYTAEQMQLVQRILRTKDYYEILEVPRDAGEDAVKRAYKKLALKLHPDKNKAPGAEEAFKKLSKAVQCLTDEEKKQVYDRYGDEERMPSQHRQAYHQDFMTAEDLFAAFFGGAATFHTTHHHHRGHHAHEDHGGQLPRAGLTQMLPVAILILLTLASNFASRDGGSRFSFTQTNQFRNERTTAALNVNYFVTDEFEEHYSEGTRYLAEFERQVEVYYVRSVVSECDHQEKQMYKQVMLAKRKGSQEELQKARNYPRPKCKEIERIKSRHAAVYRMAMYMGAY